MKDPTRTARLLLCTLPVLAGCTTTESANQGLSLAQLESNRRYTERIEQVGRDQQHVEQMRRADAVEVSTRNAPSSVSTTHVFAPRF